MQVLASGLVVDGTRVLGRLQPVEIPTERAKTCQKCGEIIPLRIWDTHKHACYLNVRNSPISSFIKAYGKKRSRNHNANIALASAATDLLKALE